MAEHRVVAEMKVEELEKQVAAKDQQISQLQEQLQQALAQIKQLTGAGGVGPSPIKMRNASNERSAMADSINQR